MFDLVFFLTFLMKKHRLCVLLLSLKVIVTS